MSRLATPPSTPAASQAKPWLEIVAPGLSSTLQDRGRLGLRRLGIPWAGTLADPWRRIVNALVGNATDAPVIESFEAGLTVEASGGAVRVAGGGELTLSHRRSDGSTARVAPWRSVVLQPGDRLRIESTGDFRLGLLALAGIEVAPHHGSRSGYARAGLGGLNGGPLAAGDRLPVGRGVSGTDLGVAAADLGRCTAFARSGDDGNDGADDAGNALTLHAVPGPQDDAFDDNERLRFFETDRWRVGNGTDRMGCRLDGPPLQHRRHASADIVSDAILPGSVQVPGSGQPIVLLNDAHTAGGYTKIATVIGADLMPLALARPGRAVRFARIDAAHGVQLARRREASIVAILERLQPVVGIPDGATLLRHNLIAGAIDALSVEQR